MVTLIEFCVCGGGEGGLWHCMDKKGGGLRSDVQDSVKLSVGGYRVFIVEMIVDGGFFVDMESFYSVEAWAFLM